MEFAAQRVKKARTISCSYTYHDAVDNARNLINDIDGLIINTVHTIRPTTFNKWKQYNYLEYLFKNWWVAVTIVRLHNQSEFDNIQQIGLDVVLNNRKNNKATNDTDNVFYYVAIIQDGHHNSKHHNHKLETKPYDESVRLSNDKYVEKLLEVSDLYFRSLFYS